MNKSAGIALAIIIIIIIVAGAAAFMKGGKATNTTTSSVAGGAASGGTTTSGAATNNVIKIGMSISLTGKFAEEGHQALCGVLASINYFNDKGGVTVNGKTYKLKLIYYDDKSDKNTVTQLYSKLVTQDKVNFLLAPYSSGLTSAAAPIAQQYKIVMLSHGGASDSIFQQGNPYIVQILTPATKYFASALELVKEKIPDAKIAFIYENSEFSNTVMKGAEEYAKQLGLDVVYKKAYEKGTTDFNGIVSEAKASGANVLIGGGHFQDGQQLVKTAHDLGWHLKFISILVAPAQPNFANLGKDVVLGVAAPAQWAVGVKYSPDNVPPGYTWFGPTNQEWLNYFNKVTQEYSVCSGLKGEPPAYQAAEAGAAIVWLVKSIETANSLDNTQVRQAMNNLALYTFFGKLKIDPQTGLQIGHQMVVIQWQEINGKLQLVIIYPPETAQANPLIAPPNWWPSS